MLEDATGSVAFRSYQLCDCDGISMKSWPYFQKLGNSLCKILKCALK